MKNLLFVLFALSLLTSCNQSTSKDFSTGLSTRGKGISCDRAYLAADGVELQNNAFTYSQKVKMVFENVKGLKQMDGGVSPGLSIVIKNEKGEVVLENEDLLQRSEPYKEDPLSITAYFIVANPMHTDQNYEAYLKIWDNNDEGTFETSLPFKVVVNDNFTIEDNGISVQDIQLYTEAREIAITNNEVFFDEKIHVLFDDLTGIESQDSLAFLGLSLTITDADNKSVMYFEDLFSDYSESGVPYYDVKDRVSCNFVVQKREVKSPLLLDVKLWDKLSKREYRFSTAITISEYQD